MQPEEKPVEPITPSTATAEETPAATTGMPPASNRSKKRFGKKQWIILIVVLVLLAGAAAYFLTHKTKAPAASKQAATTTTPTKTVTVTTTEAEAQITRFTTPTTGETWYPTPKKLPLQGYFNKSGYTEDDSTTYFEVGKRGDNTIIMSQVEQGGGIGINLFEKTPAGKVTAILHPNANATYTAEYDGYTKDDVATNIATDVSQHYDSLSIPSQLSIDTSEAVSLPDYPSLGQPIFATETGVTKTTIKKYGSSSLVKTEHAYADTHLTAIGYKIETPLGTEISMTYAPIGTKLSGINWTAGKQITADFAGIVRGCGAGISVSRGDSVTDADFVKAGTTASGQVIYNFASSDATLVQKAWQETKDFYSGSSEPDYIAKANISITDFIANHGIFAQKDPVNGWLIYTSTDYAPVGGCAKPVVYLYPATPEQVSVKVGADVKVSDPLYNPTTGWHVFAWPNGQLTVAGKTYGSLFWEGPGHGDYPSITTGTVVKRSDVVATMRTQLEQQGLNQTETDDFVAYWSTRIPNQPYVRLTWFNTAQMNALAPLTITPRPTTVIRVFLDMAGYNTPVSMPAQTLSSTPRTGFTAIEWGGLALSKIY